MIYCLRSALSHMQKCVSNEHVYELSSLGKKLRLSNTDNREKEEVNIKNFGKF